MPLTVAAQRGDYTHLVRLRGEVESSINVEVKCEVESGNRSPWNPTIEKVVPEGTHVEPGDFLVQLDVSYHEDKVREHQSLLAAAYAWQAMALSRLETARSRLEEFQNGTYELQRMVKEHLVFSSREKVREAEVTYSFSKILLREGILTEAQLEADQYALQSARNQLERAEIGSEVLRKYTRQRTLQEMESEIAAAEANKLNVERYVQIFKDRLKHYEEQVEKAILVAPVAGEVVHAHLHHRGHSHMVAVGEETQEGRVLIRLPNSKNMQVKALVAEEDIDDVDEGMPAEIRLDALPKITLHGRVTKVNEYAEADTYWSAAVKKFAVLIGIDAESVVANNAELRPGLTADVVVIADHRQDQIQIPFQAVLKHGKTAYCLTVERGRWTAHELQVGPTNGSFIIVREGLEAGQRVVLHAESYRSRIEWPELPPEDKQQKNLRGETSTASQSTGGHVPPAAHAG